MPLMTKSAPQPVEADVIESALRTISIERNGLESLERALQNGLGKSFQRAVELVLGLSGRVIITGVGKSGHIGAKLAASLASTGTPASFVHAAEASHGDLGMISRDDAVLAVSWSGETAELQTIVAYCRRFSIPLIALTAGEISTLARESDVVLLLPKEQEACPHGLAPTTSTLMQLALGDALTVALLEARGFTALDFRIFHPGGKLGAMLSYIGDIMHTGDTIPLVAKGTPLPQSMRLGPGGELVRAVLPRYAALYRHADRVWAACDAALEDATAEAGRIPDAEVWAICVEALSINYRVTAAEISALGLIDDHCTRLILWALVDRFAWDDAQKKTTATPASGGGSGSGA